MMRLSLLLLSLLPWTSLAADTALIECRQIDDIEKRVACYDDIVDSRYRSDSSGHTDAAAAPAPAEDREVPDAQSLFGTGDAEARQIVETTLEIEQIEQIEATVSDVRESVGDKMIVTLDNGQIWRQLDSKTLHLKNGEVVIIRKASFGSFLLEKKSGSRSIRMKRIS
ncbi:MAG: hypothetical protein QNJ11_06740 [Woeseiaceae bacterium]|nr:hypothetical protein [Woeseiaceae bacterium]